MIRLQGLIARENMRCFAQVRAVNCSLRVLNFHDLGTRASNDRACTRYPTDLFQSFLRLAHSRGWRTVALSSAVEKLQRGEALPAYTFSLTFDDGYESFYSIAMPLLLELGFTATLFVNAGEGPSGDSNSLQTLHGLDMLTWAQLRDICANGFEVGSHGRLHEDMRELSDTQLLGQLHGSKAALETHLNTPVTSFAYPYGRQDHRVREATQTYYQLAFTDELAVIEGTSNPFELARIDMAYFDRKPLLPLLLSRALPVYLSVRRLFIPSARAPVLSGSPAHQQR